MHACFVSLCTQFLCLRRPGGKLSVRYCLRSASGDVLLVDAGIGLLDEVVLQAGGKLPGGTDDAAGLGLTHGNLLTVLHDAISILNKVFAAVLAPTEAVPPHDHVHELVVHQLSDIVDVHHGRDLCAAIWKREHVKVRRIDGGRCRFCFLHQFLYSLLKALEAKCPQAFHRVALGIFLILDHDSVC